jgi:hypothetical protein
MIPVIGALLSALAPTLANTVADKLLGADHPLADTAKKAVLDVAQEVIGDKINDRTQAEEAGVQIGTDPELKLEFQRLLNARLANDAAQETIRLQAELADRQNARNRDIATGDTTGRHLAYAVFLVWACANAWLLIMGQPENVSDAILGRALGMIDGVTMLVASFHWGGMVRTAASK